MVRMVRHRFIENLTQIFGFATVQSPEDFIYFSHGQSRSDGPVGP
jgi:hypothetical protein